MIDLRVGNCIDVLAAEPDASFDAIVSDWPAGVAFMGRAWDKSHGGRDAWVSRWAAVATSMLRVAKPGAYALVWALPRTAHWTATALEDGGWEIQDSIAHVFGQGWPKGKSALKPASEHWIVARKGTGGALQIDAARVRRGVDDSTARTAFDPHGYSPAERLNEARVNGGSPLGLWPPNFALSHHEACEPRGTRKVASTKTNGAPAGKSRSLYSGGMTGDAQQFGYASDDGTEITDDFDCLAACDCGFTVLAQAGDEAPRCACGAAMWWACPVAESRTPSRVTRGESRFFSVGRQNNVPCFGDEGGASRFFPRFRYLAKASGGERHAGCESLYWRRNPKNPFGFDRISREEWERLPEEHVLTQAQSLEGQRARARARGNAHATVKPIELMEWLCALACPPTGRLLDVTMGSGSTAIAWHRVCERAGVEPQFLGIDICPEAVEIAKARLAWWRAVRLNVEPTKPREELKDDRQRSLF